MKYLSYIFIILTISCKSCSHPTTAEKDLRGILNKPLHLEVFGTVRQGNTLLPFDDFRQQFDFLSVVYLQNSCRPCYPKFIEWQNKMDSINTPIDYTVLFIIGGGNRYDEFMLQVLDLEYVEDKFYTIMDPELRFLANNKDIPDWILNSAMLIDQENKIKMVGAPWINEDMKNLFYRMVKNE